MDKNKMLIDATHPEETRVVVLRNGRVEEFDFESASRKLLRGNIYLAKVTRVEPSLQAAFVEYGGNRHGFLAFAEIHPDYYQIPIADRELLKQEEADAEAAAEAEADERSRQRESRRRRGGGGGRGEDRGDGDRADRLAHQDGGEGLEAGAGAPYDSAHSHDDGDSSGGAPRRAEALGHDHDAGDSVAYDRHSGHDRVEHDRVAHDGVEHDRADHAHGDAGGGHSEPSLRGDSGHYAGDEPYGSTRSGGAGSDVSGSEGHGSGDHGNVEEVGSSDRHGGDDGSGDVDQVEQVATGEDALEELPERPRRRARQYKIQEVIKRRQIILVQIVKEERGNKGAALTTYISLAGRYTVLMPNTGRGGGISRKITQPQDRKRLKAIAEDLEVSEGMGLIIRTAGAAQSKQEIKRDYEYLLRLWESVRDLTLTSTAPCLVYEEGNLIKRSIRDLYSKDIDDIQVAGPAAYAEASDFMGMLMPGHQDSVVNYVAPEPLFARFGIERQLNAMFNPTVTLRSGGYIVINQTEALVAIDVNSGKSTREFSIEETALNTNLEASEEIARQLKLRDLAGLIVVDFIDMEEKRNNRTVERRMKDALRHDRARIQVGRISHFGLLEMSRQRLRTGVVEGSTSQCPHCVGTGIIRSTESIALAVLRGIEDHLMKQPASMAVTTNAGVALYILNNKRPYITEIEQRFGITITVEASDRMHGANFAIERSAAALVDAAKPSPRTAVSMDWGFDASEPDSTEDAGAGRDTPREQRHGRERQGQDRGGQDRGGQDRNGSDRNGHDRGSLERGGRDHREPLEVRDGGDEPRNRDEVRADGEDGGRSRRRRRRRGRRDRVGGGDERGHGHHESGHVSDDRGEHQIVAASQDDDGHAPQVGQAADENRHERGHNDHQEVHREAGATSALAFDDTGAPQRQGRRVAGFEHDHGSAPVDLARDVGRDGDDNSPGVPLERDAGSDDDNRSKRGRRRGRRGGRSRGRDEHSPHGEQGAAAPDDWNLLEVAKPGAEQPVAAVGDASVTVPNDHHRGIVTSSSEPVDRVPQYTEAFVADVPARASIVETVAIEAPAPAPIAAPVAAPVQILETPSEPRYRVHVEPVQTPVVEQAPAPVAPTASPAEVASGPARKGWWQRRFGTE